MPTRNINLTGYYDEFVNELVTSGRFSSASEVMRAGLRLLEQQAREEDEKLALLRSMATEAFNELDRGQGIVIDSGEQLAEFIGQIGPGPPKWPKPADWRLIHGPLRHFAAADRDIHSILVRTHEQFGPQGRLRYESLWFAPFLTSTEDPQRIGSNPSGDRSRCTDLSSLAQPKPRGACQRPCSSPAALPVISNS